MGEKGTRCSYCRCPGKWQPDEPVNLDISTWYRNWEMMFDLDASMWSNEGWRAYKGGCDLDATNVSAASWQGLLDAIDEHEDD